MIGEPLCHHHIMPYWNIIILVQYNPASHLPGHILIAKCPGMLKGNKWPFYLCNSRSLDRKIYIEFLIFYLLPSGLLCSLPEAHTSGNFSLVGKNNWYLYNNLRSTLIIIYLLEVSHNNIISINSNFKIYYEVVCHEFNYNEFYINADSEVWIKMSTSQWVRTFIRHLLSTTHYNSDKHSH